MDSFARYVILLTLCLHGSQAEKWTSPMSFRCSRPTTPCMSGGSCNANGQCMCTRGFQGLQCGVLASAMDMMGLSCLDHDPCVEGQCYDRGDGQGASCICKAGYYGAFCNLSMFDVDCYEDRMVLYLLPWGYDVDTWSAGLEQPFLENTPAALLDTIAAFTQRQPDFVINDERRGFVGQFLHFEDQAASSAKVVFQNGTAITVSRTVVVTYDRSAVQTAERLTVKCTVPYVAPTVPPGINQSPTTPTTLLPPPVTTTTPPISFYRPGGRDWSGKFPVEWDCRRPTTPCYGSGDVCDISGVCQCPAGLTGLDCSIPTDRINQGDCAFSTLNPCDPEGGVCYDSGYGAMCACADGYYGDHCQHPMVQTMCSPLHMVVNVFPYGYDGNWPDPNLRPNLRPDGRCPMKTVAELRSAQPELTSPGWEGFAHVYLHVNDPCARDADIESENAMTRVYSRTMEVNYTTYLSHYLDHSVVVRCPVLLQDLPLTTAPASTPPPTTTTTTATTTTTTTTTPAPTLPPTSASTTLPPTAPPTLNSPTSESTSRTMIPQTTTNVPPNITQELTTTNMTTITTSPPANQTTSPTPALLRPDDTSPMTFLDLGQGQSTPSSQGQTTVSNQAGNQLPSPEVSITLMDENMKRVGVAAKLGSLVLAEFSLHPLNNNKGVTDIRVEHCVMRDQVTGNQFFVVKNSCAQQPIGMLLYSKKEGTRILIFKVMKFPTAVKLSFSCSIRLCAYNDSTCQRVRSCTDRYPRSVQNTQSIDSNNPEVTETLQSVMHSGDPGMTSVVETILIGY